MKAVPHVILIFLLGIVISCGSSRYEAKYITTTRVTLSSIHVKDSFDIHISFPVGYDSANGKLPVIYYMDANLKSGNKLREIVDGFNKTGKPINAILVGVGHFHNYRVLRRRDFITPFIKNGQDSLISDEKNFGQSENFYLFLKKELIPFIEQNYKASPQNRTYIGHSLSGLFAFYCLLKKDRLFETHISLSPALWINYDNIYEFEKKYRKDSASLHATMHLVVGSQEKLNYILDGGRKMNKFLTDHPYDSLNFTYKEFEGETHNSEVPLALEMLLPGLYK